MASRNAGRPRRASYAKYLIIMAKSPVAGRVKQRLGREIGDVAAIRFYRSCLSHTVLRLVRDRRWQILLAVDPDRDVAARFQPPPKLLARVKQGEGDLGRRMQRLFVHLPPGPAIIVGSDIPAMRASDIARAFAQLGRADAVFGPAPDGGYWLIGLKRTPKVLALFVAVRWSTRHALADTLKNLEGKRVAFAATLADIDTAKDYRSLLGAAERLILPPRFRLIQL
jgi:rSAM/selenodomain-associated transferase 1